MEVAGLVIAVYPAVILAFEQYKKGARYCRNWNQFRRRYENFIRDVEGQQLFFEGILQDLICGGYDPFLAGNSSKDIFLRLVSDKFYPGWRDPRLKQKLESRLGKHYKWCLYTIQRIYDILKDFETLLDIQELDSGDDSPDWWRIQWERIIQALFDQERHEELNEAKRLVEELQKMLELSDKYTQQRVVGTDSIFVPFFKRVQHNANSLHEALKSGWHCCCSSTHKAMLQLERRADDIRASDFNVLFVLPPNKEHDSDFIRGKGADDLAGTATYTEQGVNIKVLKDEKNETLSSALNIPLTLSVTDAGSLETSSPPTSTPQRQVEPVKITNRERTGFRSHLGEKVRISFASSDGIQQQKQLGSETIAFAGDNSSNRNSSGASKIPVEATSTEFSITSHSEHESKRNSAGFPIIPDLCHAIKNPEDKCLGYLIDQRKKYYQLFVTNRSTLNPEPQTAITLQDLLDGDSHRFPPEKRASVASILASSLLQLQQTHWINENWSKRDIFFKTNGDKVLFEQPYVSREFSSAETCGPTLEADAPPATPAPYLKRSLECLGIVLIELCFGEAIEKMQHKVRLRPLGASDQHNHEFCLAIANAWTWEEINAQEPSFSDPISYCLHFPKAGRAKQEPHDEVIQDVYSAIIEPLYDELTRRWPYRSL